MNIDRANSGPDSDTEELDERPSAPNRPPPPDRPGEAGYPSRAESRRLAAAANEVSRQQQEALADEEGASSDAESASRDLADRAPSQPAEKDGGVGPGEQHEQAAAEEKAEEPPADAPEAADGAEATDYERPEDLAARRARELQEQLPEKSRGRVTMAVGIVEAADGQRTSVVGTSEPHGYLRPGVSLEEGEVVAPGNGHAETDIIDWAEQRERSVLTIGAGRPICAACASEIRRVDAQPATRLKEEK